MSRFNKQRIVYSVANVPKEPWLKAGLGVFSLVFKKGWAPKRESFNVRSK